MSNAERLKDYIAMEIANFLILDGIMPERVDITVNYHESQARLHLEAERLERIFRHSAEGEKSHE